MTDVNKYNLAAAYENIDKHKIVTILLKKIKTIGEIQNLSDKETFLFCMATMANESLFDPSAENPNENNTAQGLGQINDGTFNQLTDLFKKYKNHDRLNATQSIELVLKLLQYTAEYVQDRLNEKNLTFTSTEEKLKYLDFSYARGIGSFKIYLNCKDKDIKNLTKYESKVIDRYKDFASYFNNWMKWYTHFEEAFTKLVGMYADKEKKEPDNKKDLKAPQKKPSDTPIQHDKKTKKTVLATTESLINRADRLITEKNGDQTVNAAEKALAFNNAVTNKMYQRITNILKTNKLNEFVGDSALAVVLSFMSVESRCDIKTQQDTDYAVGVMQVSTGAAKDVGEEGVDLTDIDNNIRIGIKYMNHLMKYMKKHAIKNNISVWNAQKDYLSRLAWVCLGYNNGITRIKTNYIAGLDIKKTTYYNDIKAFYDYWSASSVLAKLRASAATTESHHVNHSVYYVKNNHVISESLLRQIIKHQLL